MNVALILSLLLLGCVVHHCDCLPREVDDEKIKAQLASLDNEPDWLKPLSSDNDTDELIPMPAVLRSPGVESGPDVSGIEPVGVTQRASGYVVSPGYSTNRYPNNYQGYWRAYTSRGYVFRVSFTVLSLEYHSRCAYDSVSLYDGYTRSSRLIGKYCRSAPRVITTTGRSIYLYFKTDSSVNRGRFRMVWQTVRQSQQASCGTPAITPSVSTRIVGGTEARAHSWPWQCIVYTKKNNRWYRCGGSVISSRYILTAAHCLYLGSKRRSDQRQASGTHVVKCGLHNRRVSSSRIQTFSGGIRTFIHENYNTRTVNNDIAVIRLPRALTFNNYVHPICLSRSSIPAGTNCVVTGWGRTKNTGDNSVLRQVVIDVVNFSTCRAVWGRTGVILTSSMLCAGSVGGKSSCMGDSGGPLVCKRGNKWFEYGIVSFGHRSNCASPIYPKVFANVVNLLPWIQRKTGIRPSGRQTFDDDSSDDDSDSPIKPDVLENDLVEDDDSDDDLFEEEKEMLDELQRKSADRNFDDDSSDDDSDPPIEPEKELQDKPPPDDVNAAEKELLDLLQRKFADD